MIMLAVSTSAKRPSAALLLDDGSLFFREDASGRPHSVSLMPLVDELLREHGVAPGMIDCFAADVGPGSFTGVRIGVSAVNAMAFALDKPVIPVSSLDALRMLAGDPYGEVLAMIDCRGGNGYAAVYSGGERVIGPSACVQQEMLDTAPAGAELVGDCMGGSGQPDARLVILAALEMPEPAENAPRFAVPMYLRPSQAERMKK